MKILKSLVIVFAMVALVAGATSAYLSDSIQVAGNSFAAGSLVLNVDGSHTAAAKFNVANMVPGNQPSGNWTIANVGSINGYLDIENVVVTNNENTRNAAEIAAGDTTDAVGELGDVVNISLYVDVDKDGWWSAGDISIYNGLVSAMPSHFELDRLVAAGTDTKIQARLDWWSTPNDNLAQTDSMTIDLTFELAQTTGQ